MHDHKPRRLNDHRIAPDGALLSNDFGAALPKGLLSTIDNPIGFAGCVFNAPDEVYTVRNRSYDFR